MIPGCTTRSQKRFAIANDQVPSELAKWEAQARRVTITRDDWGIAHVKGRTDADAVFGAVYAQAQDDFNRVEMNFINSQGRLAEAEGEGAIWRDLRMKLFIDPEALKAQYAASPEWLRKLMQAWADGLNFYLARHPGVKPRVIRRFDPWMALTFSEGSIGGDIERVDLGGLQAFYSRAGLQADTAETRRRAQPIVQLSSSVRGYDDDEPKGSNGMAIAPQNTKAFRPLLLINPHTSFFFRDELQITSDEGLNAYGAATWGQFFIYQGFNERVGWMHTSSAVDATDEYLETVVKKNGKFFFKYGADERPFITRTIIIPYRTANGMAERKFTAYYTHFGPVVRSQNGKWVAFRLMQRPVEALMQSFLRTKSKNLADYRRTMDLHANSSNNTIYADADGNIAYFHANFIPRRDPAFDWTKPVNGSNPATEWKGLLSFEQSPNVINPDCGWVYNANDAPWMAAGPNSPKRSEYPAYVDNGTESDRGRHAVMVLQNRSDFSILKLRDAAFDTYLPAFEKLIPPLLRAYDQTLATNSFKAALDEQIDSLRHWNLRWNVSSAPTSLAIFYGTELDRLLTRSGDESATPEPSDADRLQALGAASDKLKADFGSWKIPWGEINRFQRLDDQIEPHFDDSAPSTAVGFPSAKWGSLASFGARAYPNTKHWYGASGNSFVAVVEFGINGVSARAVTAGGISGTVGSKHFNDQAQRYATGDLREVYFYPHQLKGHTERIYKP
ncbi:MAG TPA: penicillin acylase family protein [Verrucomicrobiae bacterium]|nr:penicillin acylase family protein [Verrucomicrobiae bacterium]